MTKTGYSKFNNQNIKRLEFHDLNAFQEFSKAISKYANWGKEFENLKHITVHNIEIDKDTKFDFMVPYKVFGEKLELDGLHLKFTPHTSDETCSKETLENTEETIQIILTETFKYVKFKALYKLCQVCKLPPVQLFSKRLKYV